MGLSLSVVNFRKSYGFLLRIQLGVTLDVKSKFASTSVLLQPLNCGCMSSLLSLRGFKMTLALYQSLVFSGTLGAGNFSDLAAL